MPCAGICGRCDQKAWSGAGAGCDPIGHHNTIMVNGAFMEARTGAVSGR